MIYNKKKRIKHQKVSQRFKELFVNEKYYTIDEENNDVNSYWKGFRYVKNDSTVDNANGVNERIKCNLSALAWGWNSGGRAGNQTEIEIRTPKQIQKSKDNRFIQGSAGYHHSALLSDEGIICTFGEGKCGQLGYGNQFTTYPEKGGQFQSFPAAITPSGGYKNAKDLKITQIECGGYFTIGREVSPIESNSLLQGFDELFEALIVLRKLFGDSMILNQIWSVIQQEKFKIKKISQGNLIVWGTGKYGELGLGNYAKFSPYPQVITKLINIPIVQVAAGAHHVLAIDMNGKLYSWGRNTSGQLGHGDAEHRSVPELIKFFVDLRVEYCAAGDAHSAVLTSNRFAKREGQLFRVSTFGRGAHGRLGNGTNRNSTIPVLVTDWLPSLEGVQYQQIACGGAHTLLLGHKKVPVSLAFPFGVQTFVIAWGYGQNGQLGTGYQSDSFVPVKCRFPKAVVIGEISAGRSWSMARSIGGDLYVWGKGLRGQLGQERRKFSFAPEKIDIMTSFIQISSGYAHNVAISVARKNLNDKIMEENAKKWMTSSPSLSPLPLNYPSKPSQTNKSSRYIPSAEDFGEGPPPIDVRLTSTPYYNLDMTIQRNAYNPFTPIIDSKLKKLPNYSDHVFDCCRRNSIPIFPAFPNFLLDTLQIHKKSDVVLLNFKAKRCTRRFRCDTCELSHICMDCARICHRRHNVVEIMRDPIVEGQSGSSYPPVMKRHNIDDQLQHMKQKRQQTWDDIVYAMKRSKMAGTQVVLTTRPKVASPKKTFHLSTISSLSKTDTRAALLRSFNKNHLARSNSIIRRSSATESNRLKEVKVKKKPSRSKEELAMAAELQKNWKVVKHWRTTTNATSNDQNGLSIPAGSNSPTNRRSPAKGTKSSSPNRLRTPSQRSSTNNRLVRTPNKSSSSSTQSSSPLSRMPRTSLSPQYNRLLNDRGRSRKLTKVIKTDSTDEIDDPQELAIHHLQRMKGAKVLSCRCGLFNMHCRILPMISELPLEDHDDLQEFLFQFATNRFTNKYPILDRIDSKFDGYLEYLLDFCRKSINRMQLESYRIDQLEDDYERQRLQPMIRRYQTMIGHKKWIIESIGICRKDSQKIFQSEHFFLNHKSAFQIQSLARKYIRKCQLFKVQRERKHLIRTVSTQHYMDKILHPIFEKVSNLIRLYKEREEVILMQYEDVTMKKFVQYNKLQTGLMKIDGVMFGVKKIIGNASSFVPRIRDGVITNELKPTFAFTLKSIRDQQLQMRELRRVNNETLLYYCKYFPRVTMRQIQVPALQRYQGHTLLPPLSMGDTILRRHEGWHYDNDLNLISTRYVRDSSSEEWRRKQYKLEAEIRKQQEQMAAEALKRLKTIKFRGRNIIAQAEAILKDPTGTAGLKKERPVTPTREDVRKAKEKRRADREKMETEKVLEDEKFEDAAFDPLAPSLPSNRRLIWYQRRNSIADPSNLLKRLSTTFSIGIYSSAFSQRRYSLPCVMSSLYSTSHQPPLDINSDIERSLSMFKDCHEEVSNLLSDVHAFEYGEDQLMAASSNVNYVRKSAVTQAKQDQLIRRIIRIQRSCLLHTRYPNEANEYVSHTGRRKSIGEPERFAKQLNVMVDTRDKYSDLIKQWSIPKYEIGRRRRSFDIHEEKDQKLGLFDAFNHVYEHDLEIEPTSYNLSLDLKFIQQKIDLKPHLIPKPDGDDEDGMISGIRSNETKSKGPTKSTAATVSTGKNENMNQKVEKKNIILLKNRFLHLKSSSSVSAIDPDDEDENLEDLKTKKSIQFTSPSLRKTTLTAVQMFRHKENHHPVKSKGGKNGKKSSSGASKSIPKVENMKEERNIHGILSVLRSFGESRRGVQHKKSSLFMNDTIESLYKTPRPKKYHDDTSTLASNEIIPIEVWKEFKTENGTSYFYSIRSGETKWEIPTHLDSDYYIPQIESQYYDEFSKRWYWYNQTTGESTWIYDVG